MLLMALGHPALAPTWCEGLQQTEGMGWPVRWGRRQRYWGLKSQGATCGLGLQQQDWTSSGGWQRFLGACKCSGGRSVGLDTGVVRTCMWPGGRRWEGRQEGGIGKRDCLKSQAHGATEGNSSEHGSNGSNTMALES